MAYVSDETLDELRRELRSFKNASGHQSVYAAAHLAGAIEALIEEAHSDTDAQGTAHTANPRW